MTDKSTSDLVLELLGKHGLKQERPGEYRCNRPWSNGSDSHSLTVKIDGPEFGCFYDHVLKEGGSLYQLAGRLGISLPEKIENTENGTKRGYFDLADYALAHGVGADVFTEAGWTEARYPYPGDDHDRRGLRFPTKTGERWRFLDGRKPAFKSPAGYKLCWYGITRAAERAKETGQPLIICNGEPSVVVAQHYGLPAVAVTSGEHRTIKPELLAELQETWSGPVLIAPDCDTTGAAMASGWADQLTAAGYQVQAVNLNGGRGFDLADFCALHKENSTVELSKLDTLGSDNERGGRFKPFDALDALSFDEPIDWVIEDLLATCSVAVLSGKGGSGKTYALLDCAVKVAMGEKFLDRTTRKCKVLLVDEESGPKRLKRRLKRILTGNFAEGNLQKGYITCTSLPFLNLSRETDALALEALILSVGAELVIIDALIDVAGGADENKSQEMHIVMQRMRQICERCQCAIIVIHHTNKTGGTRGSSTIENDCDLALIVESTTGADKSVQMNFSIPKSRDIENIQFGARLHFSEGMTWLTSSDVIKKDKDNRGHAYVKRILTERGPLPLPEIMGAADTCSPSTARDAVYSLAREGVIYRTNPNETGRGVFAIYAMREDISKK